MYEDKGMGLNYEMLLLNHLNRISHLSTFIAGEYITNQGQTISKETDKETSFIWAVQVLTGFIPDEIKDNDFKKDLEKLKKEREAGKNKDSFDFHYWKGLMQISVNLLARKGFLFETKSIGRVMKEISKRSETKEEWDK